MVNKYKRKTDRQSWDEENMKKALQKVKNNEIGFKKAAHTFNVPRTTLKRWYEKYFEIEDLDKAVEKKMV